jgi:hypothetical protein
VTKEKSEKKAEILNKFVKHPHLSYRSIRVSEHIYGIGQFFKETQVSIIG